MAGDVLVAADVEGNIRGYDRPTGEVRWHRQIDSTATVFATPVLTSSGAVVVADEVGHVVAISPQEGQLQWARDDLPPVYEAPSSGDGKVFISTTRGVLIALNEADGSIAWQHTPEGPAVRFGASAFHDGLVYVGATDGVVRALDSHTGALRWTYELGEAITAPPLIAGDVVFVGAMDRQLIALDREQGTLVWDTVLKGRVKSAMAAQDGSLIVLAEPRLVYRFTPQAAEVQYAESQ